MRKACGKVTGIVILLFIGCLENYTPGSNPPGEVPPVERVDELFVKEEIENNRKRTIFQTNNEKYRNLEGVTIWTVQGEAEDLFTSRTVTLGKSVGCSGGGYGFVFCHSYHKVEGKKLPVMLVVMLNNGGHYIAGKAVGGMFKEFWWWKESTHLKRGAGSKNEITVIYETEVEEYVLKINGQEVERFKDTEEPFLHGGRNGYIVVITPFDKFPVPGISVYFEEEE